MTGLILYGTEACHLCDEAELLLRQHGLNFDKRDIIDDEQAQQRYAIRIPVLRDDASGRELGWPFDAEAIAEFVARISGG